MTGGESLEAMIERYLRATSQDLARVFDWGCGYGKALEQMLEFDCVDVDGCLGTTADMTHPPGVEADPFVAPHLSYGNALYMAPVREGTRFNVLLSIYGANQYHPLNGHNSPRFGLLHAINIIEEGGLLVISPLTEVFHMIVIKMLVDNGVIEKFDYKSAAKNGNHPLVCIVRRKPTVEEILSVLSIDFEYRLLGVGAQQGYIGHLLKKG